MTLDDIRRIGYAAFRVHYPDHQMLVQIFVDEQGLMDCQVCHRAADWQSWGPPITARRS